MAIAYRGDGGFVSRSVSDTSTVTAGVPSGTAAGDLMLLAASTFKSGGATSVNTPSGWTLISAVNTFTNFRCHLYYRVAGSSEGSVGLTTVAASFLDAVIVGFTGVDTTTPIDATAVWSSATGGSPHTVPSITTVTANAWWVLVGADLTPAQYDASSFPSGWTMRYLTATSNPALMIAQYLIDTVLVATAGATSSTTFTRHSTSGKSSEIGIALRPSSGGGGSTFVPQTIVIA